MAKTIKDLLLALLNATLILLAICLFLGWKLAQTVENVQNGFADNLQVVAPLQEQAQGIRQELAGLSANLSALRDQDTALDVSSRAALNSTLQKLDNVTEKLSDTQQRLAGLAERPEDLINHAITTSTEVATNKLIELRGCQPAS